MSKNTILSKGEHDQQLFETLLFDSVEKVSDEVGLKSPKYMNILMGIILYSNDHVKILNAAKCYVDLFDRQIGNEILNQNHAGSLLKYLLCSPNIEIYKSLIPVLTRQLYSKINQKL